MRLTDFQIAHRKVQCDFQIQLNARNQDYLDISGKGITRLNRYSRLENITNLRCCGNKIKSLEGCPPNLTKLDCSYNQLTSLRSCPPNLYYLNCANNELTSLRYCPKNVRILCCSFNYIKSLKYLPFSVKNLYIGIHNTDNCLSSEIFSLLNVYGVGYFHDINFKKKYATLNLSSSIVFAFDKACSYETGDPEYLYDKKIQKYIDLFVLLI